MLYWDEYKGHSFNLEGKRNKYDNNIYTFDIETTSYLILDGKQIPSIEYDKLNKKDQERCIFQSNMYIWMFSINDTVYYGRTWKEFRAFLSRIEFWGTDKIKVVYVHNLAFEFEFLRNEFRFKNVFARKSRHTMRAELEDFNIIFKCTYCLSNLSLENLAKTYNLNIKKLSGYLDYNKIRHSKTILTKEELQYCENDCLVVYEYIKNIELKQFERMNKIPLTQTGHVRKELKNLIFKQYDYINKVKKSINTDPFVYNLLCEAFAGGYTHANYVYTSQILKNVTSFDFTSSYPFVMCTEKYPSSEFKKVNITKDSQLFEAFAFLLVVRFKNIRSKYYNNFISQSKCRKILKGRFDNGRIISAEEIEIVLTDVDYNIIKKSYKYESYEFLEVYSSKYDYLPKRLINFILEKYIKKTEYKNVEEKQIEYAIEKANFNSIYGMCVTNTIRDKVIFDNDLGWYEEKLSNEEIVEMLEKQKDKPFLSFSYGVWVTAYARRNLLENIMKLDDNLIYADTDSLKLIEGFNEEVIKDYNNKVIEKIEKVSTELDIPIEKFKPKDIKGKEHLLGLFENDGEYLEFITQGAKKYAYKSLDLNKETNKYEEKIHITVSGVPKKGAKALKKLEDFKDNFIFRYEDTGKNTVMYNDNQIPFKLVDYQGNIEELNNRYGVCIIPTTYELGKSEEYAELIEASSDRAIFKGGVNY